MQDWWIYVLLAVGVLLLVSSLVSLALVAGWLAGALVRRLLGSPGDADGTPEWPSDDVECACCGLSRLESVRSTTGVDACPCCLRRPYRAQVRRRRQRA